MRIEVDHRWRVRAHCHLDLPLRPQTVWGQMRDWRRFICIDPLHAYVRTVSSQTSQMPVGTRIIISHRLLGFGPERAGRILRWRENEGFAFSDMSKRGRHVGFPHVCFYRLEPLGDFNCRMIIGAHGRWTAKWVPRWLVKAWLWWVLIETRSCIRRDMRQFCTWRNLQGGPEGSATDGVCEWSDADETIADVSLASRISSRVP